MAKVQGFILYKISYKHGIVYLGRTKQPLQDRIRGHMFKKPMHRSIDINLVTKIEYAEFKTEADMFLYEVYFINTLKPPLNVDDRAKDDITVMLPDVEFQEFKIHLWNKWLEDINGKAVVRENKTKEYYGHQDEMRDLREKKRLGILNDDEYDILYDEATEKHRQLQKELFK